MSLRDEHQFEKGRIQALKNERIYIQKKTFTKWANAFLEKARIEIKDLFHDLADGKILMKLLEIISGETIGKPNKGMMRIQKVENVSRCLKFLITKVYFENVGAEDIVDGNPNLILGLIWTIILRFQINEITIEVDEESNEKMAAKDALLLWCKRKTVGYPWVNIINFTTSWRNGLGFNALIHEHRPDLVDYDCLYQEEHISNLNNAFIVASEELGIPKILDAEDVDVNNPDEKSILTYVASYYHYFNRIKSEIADEKKPAFALPETLIPQVNTENFDEEDLVEKTVEVLLKKEKEKQVEDEKMQDVIKTSNIWPDRVTHTYKGTKTESSKEEVQHSRLMPQINEENSEEADLVENMVDVPYEIEVEEEVETEVMQDLIETWKIPQVKVSHAYIGQGIQVAKGEVLLLIQRTNSDWWQIRKEDGHKGFVPSSYVKEVKPKVTQKVIRKPMKVTEKVKVTVMKKEVVKNNSEKSNKMIMASSSSDDFCTFCQDDDVTRQAVKRCIECEVFLCPECDNHHRKSRLSKSHRIMTTEDFNKLPTYMKEITSQCKDHDEKFELYCSFHACACCIQCVTSHKKCQDLKPLSDILSSKKSSVTLLEKDLNNMKKNLVMILNYLKDGKDKNDVQKAKATEDILIMRKSIDTYLNILEQQFLGILETKHLKLKLNMNPLVKNIEHRSLEMHKLLQEFFKMKQYATELQMYIGLRDIEKTTSEVAKYIENLKSGGHLEEYDIEIKISSDLQSILDVKSFGEIHVNTSSSSYHLWEGGRDQRQRVDPTVRKIDHKLPLIKTPIFTDDIHDIGPKNVYDCRIAADDRTQTTASSLSNDVCSLCQDDNVSSQAVTRCTECEVFLCPECDKHHRKARLSKHHKPISTEDFNKLPVFMKKISSQCKDHNMRFELYCPFHACPCCVQCVYKHQKCQDIKPLSDILSQIKSSASVLLCENELNDLNETFEVILNYLKQRIDKNHIQKMDGIEKIHTMRRAIDDYLNELEQNILVDLETKHSTLESNMNSLLKHIEHQSNKICNLQEKLSKMTKYATELQMYVGLMEMEKATSEVKMYIEDLKSGCNLNENTLEIEISFHLESMSEVIKSFGEINITARCFPIQVKTGRKDQAQDLVSTAPGIEQIQPLLVRTLTEEIGPINVCACRILPDSNFIILDSHKKQLLLFSHDGIFIKTVVTFNEFTGDLCLVENNTVAVTFESNVKNQTALVDIEKNEVSNTIELSHDCLGVTSDFQMLVISGVGSKKSTMVNLKDMSQNILEGVWGNRILLYKDKIYCIDSKQHKVNCYERTGEHIWTFMDNEINNPCGLALDINGFVYIASFGKSTIVVVSPDATTSKTIRQEAVGMIKPIGIDINRNTGMMIVPCQIREDKPRILLFRI